MKQFQHFRRRSKPSDNMENDRQWKRYNRRNDAHVLSGWGVEKWKFSTVNLARAGPNKH